jgi:hypothetical protein
MTPVSNIGNEHRQPDVHSRRTSGLLRAAEGVLKAYSVGLGYTRGVALILGEISVGSIIRDPSADTPLGVPAV